MRIFTSALKSVAGSILSQEWSVIALPQQDKTGLGAAIFRLLASLLHAR
jgi:hypothetical protein